MTSVDFTVTPDTGISGYWIAVDETDVPLVNGKGSINLSSGQHILMWWMYGNEGAGISIIGKKENGQTVVEVKKSKIPANKKKAAGIRGFIV